MTTPPFPPPSLSPRGSCGSVERQWSEAAWAELDVELAFSPAAFGTHLPRAQAGLSEMRA